MNLKQKWKFKENCLQIFLDEFESMHRILFEDFFCFFFFLHLSLFGCSPFFPIHSGENADVVIADL